MERVRPPPPLHSSPPPLRSSLEPFQSSQRSLPSMMGFGPPTVPIATQVTWWIVSISAAVVFIGIVLLLISKYFNKSLKMLQERNGRILFGAFVFCLLLWIAQSALTIYMVYDTTFSDATNHPSEFVRISPKLFYNIARFVTISFFIIKGYLIFMDSAYAVRKCFVVVLCILNLIAFGLQIYPLISHVSGHELSEEGRTEKQIRLSMQCSGWSLDFLVSALAMWKFVQTLFRLTLSLSSGHDEGSATLTKQQVQMLQLITSNTNLCVWALFSSIVLGVFINRPYSFLVESENFIDRTNSFTCAIADSALNAVCMYLSYAFANNLYQSRFVCKYCHRGMNRLCVRCTKQRIKRKQRNEKQEQTDSRPIQERVGDHVGNNEVNPLLKAEEEPVPTED